MVDSHCGALRAIEFKSLIGSCIIISAIALTGCMSPTELGGGSDLRPAEGLGWSCATYVWRMYCWGLLPAGRDAEHVFELVGEPHSISTRNWQGLRVTEWAFDDLTDEEEGATVSVYFRSAQADHSRSELVCVILSPIRPHLFKDFMNVDVKVPRRKPVSSYCEMAEAYSPRPL